MKDKHILIVDDEEEIRRMIADELSEFGAIVYQAKNGREAFQLILDLKVIDLVLTDVRMPGGDGSELAKNIKGLPNSKIKIVFMSAFNDLMPDDLKALGVSGYIAKPFQWDNLIDSINAFFT